MRNSWAHCNHLNLVERVNPQSQLTWWYLIELHASPSEYKLKCNFNFYHFYLISVQIKPRTDSVWRVSKKNMFENGWAFYDEINCFHRATPKYQINYDELASFISTAFWLKPNIFKFKQKFTNTISHHILSGIIHCHKKDITHTLISIKQFYTRDSINDDKLYINQLSLS